MSQIPPQDLDAESAVLSAVMLEGAVDRVADILRPEHFYSQENGDIFRAACELATTYSQIDPITIKARLVASGKLRQDGAAYLMQLCDATPSVQHLEAHAQIVVDMWRRRQAIEVSRKTAAEGYGEIGDVQAWLDERERALFDVVHSKGDDGQSERLRDILHEEFRRIEQASERGGLVGISTGRRDLDKITGGLHRGDLTIIAGRPGMGKSALAADIAVSVACAVEDVGTREKPDVRNLAVQLFSLEMPREQLAMRMLCTEAEVDIGALRRNQIAPSDWSRITPSIETLSKVRVWINDVAGLSPLDLRAKVRRRMAECDRDGVRMGAIIVDYLQLMRGPTSKNGTREQEIGSISRSLKALAKELKVPVIALSQLSRNVEQRDDKRPQLSDLRESGAIEQDADNILFVYRHEYYDPDKATAKNKAELIMAKQRNGPTGTIFVRFDGRFTRFTDLDRNDWGYDS